MDTTQLDNLSTDQLFDQLNHLISDNFDGSHKTAIDDICCELLDRGVSESSINFLLYVHGTRDSRLRGFIPTPLQ
jgi:hypothetical protein